MTRSRGMLAHLLFCRGPGAAFFTSGKKKPNTKSQPAQILESSIQYRVSSIVNPESRIQYRVSRIENPTLAHFRHFRHFSSLFTPSPLYNCREPSTNQLLFMQNKPNFRKSQMNVSIYLQTDYENKHNWTIGENKPNSNPIKACPERSRMGQFLQRPKSLAGKSGLTRRELREDICKKFESWYYSAMRKSFRPCYVSVSANLT